MRKIIYIFLLTLTILVIGCKKEVSKIPTVQNLTEKQIISAFLNANIGLIRVKQVSNQKYFINGTKPCVYQINRKPGGCLYVYLFETMSEREKAGMWNSLLIDRNLTNDFSVFTARNSLILYVSQQDSFETQKFSQILGQIVWDKLNNAKEIVFKGEGKYWRASMKVKYFEYFIEEKDGYLSYDSYHFHDGNLYFKGNLAEVGQYNYFYNFPGGGGGSGSGSDALPTGKRMTNFANGGGNGKMSFDGDIDLTLKWAGKLETIKLSR